MRKVTKAKDLAPRAAKARMRSKKEARISEQASPPTAPGVGLSNVDLVTLALHSLGGTAEKVDTEDVAKRANDLAPGRLVWHKYPDQINLELVRVFLSDAKKSSNGAYVIGSGRTGWMLTERGTARAARLSSESCLPGFSSPRATTVAAQRQRAERTWLLNHPSLAALRASGADALSLRQLESLFRVDEYMVGAVRERRIARVLNAVAEDHRLVELLGPAAERVRSLRER